MVDLPEGNDLLPFEKATPELPTPPPAYETTTPDKGIVTIEDYEATPPATPAPEPASPHTPGVDYVIIDSDSDDGFEEVENKKISW